MNIIVCIKQVPDPEAPVTQFSVDAGGIRHDPVLSNGVTLPDFK